MSGDLRQSLRVLASAPSVLALVVLVVNDHFLKQAWPGLVTGKLSDVAGLAFAPLLLAVPLAAFRVRRPTAVAVVATGVGFALAKSSVTGAAVASQVWSLTGVPTLFRADLTDLLTLPALALAWWARRWVLATPVPDWRRRLSTVVGVALLPVGVLATSATSCQSSEGVVGVAAVHGGFTGSVLAEEPRLLVSSDSGAVLIDQHGRLSRPPSSEDRRLPRIPWYGPSESCLPSSPTQCWRVRGEKLPEVEASTNAGAAWGVDLALTKAQVADALEGIDPGCGEVATARPMGLAVLEGDAGPLVAVALRHGGLLVRGPGPDWLRYSGAALEAAPQVPPGGGRLGRIRRTEVVLLPGSSRDPANPDPSPTEPPCPSPSLRTVTPNPQNGPPTTYEVCV